jgi:hypothetical protein
MKKMRFTLIMLSLLTILAMPVFAGGCEPPDVCPGPFNTEVEGNAYSDGFKIVGDDNTGAIGDVFGGAHYGAKGTESAKGSADSTGHIEVEAVKTETEFSTKAVANLKNSAEAEGIVGPGVVNEYGAAHQGTWGNVGSSHNYAFGVEETKAEENGLKTSPSNPVSISGETSAEGKTEGILTSGPNFRQSDISNSGKSAADGSDSRNNVVSGAGEIGAMSSLKKGSSWAGANLSGTWCYEGNGAGKGAGVGYTRTEITRTATTVDVKSHSEAATKATAQKLD